LRDEGGGQPASVTLLQSNLIPLNKEIKISKYEEGCLRNSNQHDDSTSEDKMSKKINVW
jgi:hypothetical protein